MIDLEAEAGSLFYHLIELWKREENQTKRDRLKDLYHRAENRWQRRTNKYEILFNAEFELAEKRLGK
jgi:hypothetical protein